MLTTELTTEQKKPVPELQVCMGKACQLKGSPLLAQALRVELQKRLRTSELPLIGEVTGGYCQTQCSEGIVVRIGRETYTHITVADVPRLIDLYLETITQQS